MQAAIIVRLISSPPLSVITIDDLRRRFTATDSLLVCVSDEDLNVSVLSFRTDLSEMGSAVATLFEKIGAGGSVGRAFRLDLQTADAAAALSDEVIRSIAVAVHGAVRSPVYIARRAVAAGGWKAVRAMGWGRDGLGAPQHAPVLPYSASESLGVAIEIGQPLVLFKLHLIGLNEAQAEKILAAVGGPDSGFADVAAYLVAEQRNGHWFAVVELSDVNRTSPVRVLRVLEIEARRYGATVGAGAVLSHIPLQSVLDSLALHTGLHASPAQIVETHLTAAANA